MASTAQSFLSTLALLARSTSIIWIDEKLFSIQAIHYTYNDRVLAQDIDSLPLEQRATFRRLKPASMLCWVGVTSDGQKIPYIFMEEGVKISQHNYKEIFKSKVLRWVNSKYARAPCTFQLDGVLAHIAKLVQDWCRDNFSHLW